MSIFVDLIDLDEAEVEAACEAVRVVRRERERLAAEARRRGKPTWKNTLYSKHARHGYESIQSYANSLGYAFYEWNGWVYPTDLGLFNEANQVCVAEDLDMQLATAIG